MGNLSMTELILVIVLCTVILSFVYRKIVDFVKFIKGK
jgi:hypothetical protein